MSLGWLERRRQTHLQFWQLFDYCIYAFAIWNRRVILLLSLILGKSASDYRLARSALPFHPTSCWKWSGWRKLMWDDASLVTQDHLFGLHLFVEFPLFVRLICSRTLENDERRLATDGVLARWVINHWAFLYAWAVHLNWHTWTLIPFQERILVGYFWVWVKFSLLLNAMQAMLAVSVWDARPRALLLQECRLMPCDKSDLPLTNSVEAALLLSLSLCVDRLVQLHFSTVWVTGLAWNMEPAAWAPCSVAFLWAGFTDILREIEVLGVTLSAAEERVNIATVHEMCFSSSIRSNLL